MVDGAHQHARSTYSKTAETAVAAGAQHAGEGNEKQYRYRVVVTVGCYFCYVCHPALWCSIRLQ